jgi:uncharacterized protein
VSINVLAPGRDTLMDLAAPDGPVDVQRVAHALSNICRFAGNTPVYYSVAEHSVAVACVAYYLYFDQPGTITRQRSIEVFRAALWHDASEAFMGDLISPIKAVCPVYAECERRVATHIARQLGLAADADTLRYVHAADKLVTALEVAHFFPDAPVRSGDDVIDGVREVFSRVVCPRAPAAAKTLLLQADAMAVQNAN